MGKPILSICIPTFNFGKFIGEMLGSAIAQATEAVEIVVLDGASTDNTREIVGRFQRNFSRLKYICLPERGGIDRDMARTVEHAGGEYCWLFSADDMMTEQAIPNVLDRIRSGHDVYIVGMVVCTLDMQPLRDLPALAYPGETEFDLSNPRERTDFFSHALTSGAFFSFMSSLVVRTARWKDAGTDEAFVGSCWAHVARIFRMIPRGLRVKYLPAPFLYNRSGNDSFLDAGLVNRFSIAIDGYHRLADAYFGHDSAEAFHIRRVLKNEYVMRELLFAKLWAHEKGRPGDPEKLDALVDKLFCDRSASDRARRAIFRAAPCVGLKIARHALEAVRSFRKGSRTGS